MRHAHERGFTLLELAMVVLIFGIVIGFSVPAFVQFGRSNSLHGAAQNMASQFRLARERAISTGVDQHVHVSGTYVGYDYRIHPRGIAEMNLYSLPTGVNYAPPSFTQFFYMTKDGRSDTSVMIQLTDARHDTATVSVERSGLVTAY